MYASTRANFIAGQEIRYPDDREALGDAFANQYCDFLLRVIRKSPLPLSVDWTEYDVPEHFDGPKKQQYLKAVESLSYDRF